MILKGECLACYRLQKCRETSVEKVLASYTCQLFEPVAEAVYRARSDAMQKYGEQAAVRAMLPLSTNTEGEESDG